MDYKNNKRFLRIYPHIFNVEGGYVNDPKDPGGATNHGVAYNYNAGRLKAYGIGGPEDMKCLTRDQAVDIYYKYYWVPSQADEIPDETLALIYFDAVINCGLGTADKLLGRLNPNLMHYSAKGTNKEFWQKQILKFVAIRMKFYTSCRGRQRYLEGWINRLAHILTIA